MAKLLITQVKSGVGAPGKHRRTLQALGLKHQRSVVQDDNSAIRGMIFQVRHLVKVAEAEGQENNG
ncbi:MAG TPA: 50S ribosomal protein L30 [Longimicrobium sp.]